MLNNTSRQHWESSLCSSQSKCNALTTDCPRQRSPQREGEENTNSHAEPRGFLLQIRVSNEKKIFFFNAMSLGVPTMLQGTKPKCTWPKTLNLIKWLLQYCGELPPFPFYWWGLCHIIQEKLPNVESLSKNEWLNLLPRYFLYCP